MEFLHKTTVTRAEIVTEGAPDDEIPILNRHFDYLKSLTEQGTVLLFRRTQNPDPRTFGIVIFCAESEEEAKSIMNNDPAVKERAMRAERYPYKVAGLNPRNWPVD